MVWLIVLWLLVLLHWWGLLKRNGLGRERLDREGLQPRIRIWSRWQRGLCGYSPDNRLKAPQESAVSQGNSTCSINSNCVLVMVFGFYNCACPFPASRMVPYLILN